MLLSLFNRVLGVPSVKYAYPELLAIPVPAAAGGGIVDGPVPVIDHGDYHVDLGGAGIGAEGTDDMYESFSESIHHDIAHVEFNSFDDDSF